MQYGTGGNDYVLSRKQSNPDDVVANITKAIQTLYSLGAREFLIPNLPDLGLTPLVQVMRLVSQLLELTQTHNALLDEALNQIPTPATGNQNFSREPFYPVQTLVNDRQSYDRSACAGIPPFGAGA